MPQMTQAQTREAIKEKEAFKRQVSDALNERYSNMFKAFQFIDTDRSGRVDRQEIERALDLWNLPADDDKIKALLSQLDYDGDGVDYKEFVDALARDTVSVGAMRKRDMQSKQAMGVDAYVETNPYRTSNFA